jgi:hypothetical protein
LSRIDHAVIQRARQTDLPEFLIQMGEPLKKTGKRYQHKVHDSLYLSGNMFFWNSRQAKGNSLDFVMLYFGWKFEQAIERLTGFTTDFTSGTAAGAGQEKKENYSFLPGPNCNCKRVIAYLCKTRKIDYKIVRSLIESNRLAQDERGNAVFVIYDEAGKLIGAELAGTLSNLRFKGIAAGTKPGYGFNISIGEPKKTLFFESPIDSLSFWTLHKEKITAHRLVSLAGLRKDILENTLQAFSVPLNSAFLCVDRDQAGEQFINAVQGEFEGLKVYLPEPPFKDWNEMLAGQGA